MEKEKFDLENFPTSNSARKMLSYVSDGFYDESYVGKWIFQVMGLEYDRALEMVEDLPAQFFPETATWGLMHHEIKWGLPVRENLSYEERRKRIYQKRDYRAPMTPYRMEKGLEDATGFEVHIADIHDPGEYEFSTQHPNVFKAYFLGEGTLDSKKVFETLNRLKQSHTTYTVNYRTEIELDNRNLEQIILRNVRFKMAIPFWYAYVYDGSWRLDGSVILNTKRRYGLVLGFKFNQGEFHTPEEIQLVSVRFDTVKVRNDGMFRAGVGFHTGINFWNVRCFDGMWDLDGSEQLDAKRRYGLSLCMRDRFGIASCTEKVRLQALSSRWEQHIRENIAAGIVSRFAVDFWRLLYLDGGWNLDGEQLLGYGRGKAKAALSVRSEMDFSEQETVANATVETKTWDYWFLDGALSLNGARSLNSIYRKEAAE